MHLIKVSEAAKRLCVSTQTVRDLCDQKKITAVRPTGSGGHRRVVAESIDKYLESLVQKANPKATFVPQVIQYDDSERELDRLLLLGKKKRG